MTLKHTVNLCNRSRILMQNFNAIQHYVDIYNLITRVIISKQPSSSDIDYLKHNYTYHTILHENDYACHWIASSLCPVSVLYVKSNERNHFIYTNVVSKTNDFEAKTVLKYWFLIQTEFFSSEDVSRNAKMTLKRIIIFCSLTHIFKQSLMKVIIMLVLAILLMSMISKLPRL